ncbi:MAG: hypothetical protein EOP84_10835 [Verrucomicrobiaceae bacterium]|nr:MAG: hypothetical protein EOP84_10835 [Verrucomicrobiaceae bacterium]
MNEDFKIDVFVVGNEPFVDSEFEKAKTIELLPGRTIRVASPETIVIQKLRWFLLGNMIIDHQWNDIVQVSDTQRDVLDSEYMRHWATYFGLEELLLKAESEAIDPAE